MCSAGLQACQTVELRFGGSYVGRGFSRAVLRSWGKASALRQYVGRGFSRDVSRSVARHQLLCYGCAVSAKMPRIPLAAFLLLVGYQAIAFAGKKPQQICGIVVQPRCAAKLDERDTAAW